MLERVLTGLVLGVVVVVVAWFAPDTAAAGLVVVGAFIAGYEYMSLFSVKEHRGVFLSAVAWVALGPVSAWFGWEMLAGWLYCSPMFALGLFLIFRKRIARAWSEAPAIGLGTVYIGLLSSAIVLLGKIPKWGASGLLMLFAITWIGDSVAYFAGKSIGRHKLHSASPNKTWEGSIFGLAGSVGGAFVVDVLFSSPMTGMELVIMGLAAGVVGQVGDLCESVLKRSVGVKDSGTLLPGHGGMLDRVDALLFAAPVVYWFYLAGTGNG